MVKSLVVTRRYLQYIVAGMNDPHAKSTTQTNTSSLTDAYTCTGTNVDKTPRAGTSKKRPSTDKDPTATD